MTPSQVPREIPRGVVAYLDVLGTKGVPSGAAAIDYANRLRYFREFAQSQVEGAMGLLRSFFAVMAESPGLAEESVDHFSDSLYLWVPIDQGRDFIAIEEVASILVRLVHYGLAHRLPLRGAVSVGPFVVADDIFIGEAVSEAVEWERIGQWIGVVFAPSASGAVIREMDHSPASENLANFVFENVPIKGSPLDPRSNLLALAWPNYPPDDLRDRLDRMYLSNPLPMDVSAKYLNTMGFFDSVREKAEAGTLPRPREAEKYIIKAIWEGETATTLPPARELTFRNVAPAGGNGEPDE